MYLFNKSKIIVHLPTGEDLYPGCISSKITPDVNVLRDMQKVLTSGLVSMVSKPNVTGLPFGYIQMCYLGSISHSWEFPDPLKVHDGVCATIEQDVTDMNPEKTFTNKTFQAGQTIIWIDGTWEELPICTYVPPTPVEQIDIYDTCLRNSDVFVICEVEELADVFEECPEIPPEVITDVFEECAPLPPPIILSDVFVECEAP